jgi:ABC-type nitrate/sulfonate/bicarbonate transport system permease component
MTLRRPSATWSANVPGQAAVAAVILLSLWAVLSRTGVVDPFNASSPNAVAVCWPRGSPM